MKFLLLAVVFVVLAVSANAGPEMAMLEGMLPPGCKEQVKQIKYAAENTYRWLVNEKCKECPNGVKYSAVILKEAIARKAVDSYLDYLAKEGFDVDKLCPQGFRRKELWPLTDQFKKKCVTDTKEIPQFKDLCKAKKDSFPKTDKCFTDGVMKEFEKRASPPPMDCVQKAMDKCTPETLGKWQKHFLMDMKLDKNIHKGLNVWQFAVKFFKTKCTGKF